MVNRSLGLGLRVAALVAFTTFLFVSPAMASAHAVPQLSNLRVATAETSTSAATDPTVVKCPDCSAGYVDNSSLFGSVTGVNASFVVPGVRCNSASTLPQQVDFLAQMDGVPNPPSPADTETAGVEASCAVGSSVQTYQAVFYDSIDGSFGIANWSPRAGDVVSVTIAADTTFQVFSFTLIDFTTKESSTFFGSASGAVLHAAGCIIDMQGSTSYALANFGAIGIGYDHAKVPGTCDVTIGYSSGPVGNFGPSATLLEYKTVSANGMTLLAYPSVLSTDESSFVVNFMAAGP